MNLNLFKSLCLVCHLFTLWIYKTLPCGKNIVAFIMIMHAVMWELSKTVDVTHFCECQMVLFLSANKQFSPPVFPLNQKRSHSAQSLTLQLNSLINTPQNTGTCYPHNQCYYIFCLDNFRNRALKSQGLSHVSVYKSALICGRNEPGASVQHIRHMCFVENYRQFVQREQQRECIKDKPACLGKLLYIHSLLSACLFFTFSALRAFLGKWCPLKIMLLFMMLIFNLLS